MRNDMIKVIAERARDGSSVKVRRLEKGGRGAKRKLSADTEDAGPMRQAMSPGRHNGWDDMTRTLRSPVERFLLKQVGRPWDEVYSEVAAGAPVGSKAGQRLREVVENLVEITGVTIAGEGEEERILSSWGYSVGGLYVHPVTGLLSLPDFGRRGRRFWRRNRRQEPEVLPVPADGSGQERRFVKVDGLWYSVKLVPLPFSEAEVKNVPFSERQDVILKDCVFGFERSLKYGSRFSQYWQGQYYAREKRQVGKQELALIARLLSGEKLDGVSPKSGNKGFHRPVCRG